MFISRKEYDEMKERIHSLELELAVLKAQPVARPVATPAFTPVATVVQEEKPKKPEKIKIDVRLGECKPSGHTPESDRYDIRVKADGVDYYGSYYDEPDSRHPGMNGWVTIKQVNGKSVSCKDGKMAIIYGLICAKCREEVALKKRSDYFFSDDDNATLDPKYLPFT